MSERATTRATDLDARLRAQRQRIRQINRRLAISTLLIAILMILAGLFGLRRGPR